MDPGKNFHGPNIELNTVSKLISVWKIWLQFSDSSFQPRSMMKTEFFKDDMKYVFIFCFKYMARGTKTKHEDFRLSYL